ncbi:MAG: hypothetical protein IJY26_00950 [Clostridia bacterium]|nr:hypothetical protein [Clostridia bacterium]
MTVAFFGHRDRDYFEYHDKLLDIILDLVDNYDADKFLLGGYGRFDSFAAQTVYEVKKIRPHIKTTKVLAYYPVKAENFYLWKGYDDSVYPPIGEGLPKFAIVRRNRWIVENSDFIVSGIRQKYGGAYTAVCYAKKLKKPVLNLCE